jgi:Flp pilus assembly protein TadD
MDQIEQAKEMIKAGIKQATRLFHEGNLPGCLMLIGHILQMDPHNDDALQIAGLLKLRVEEKEEATRLLTLARQINPANPDHHNNLAVAYSRAGKYDESIACVRDAIAIAPGRPVFWTNLGVQLKGKAAGKTGAERESLLNESEAAFNKAMELDPNAATAFANLGSLSAERHQMGRAAELMEKALEIDPKLSGVHVDLSYVYFLTGQFKKGWPHYEHRMTHYPQASRWEKVFPSSKRWDGRTSLEGKTVGIFCEQGCGDAIHFARYIPLIKKMAGEVWLCCHDPLKGLMSQFCETIPMSQKPPYYDVSIPIMSLPYLLGDPETPNVYIDTKPADLSVYGGFKVGICWAGNPQHPGDRFRSVHLREFSPLAFEGVKLFSLQKDYRPRKYHDSEDVIDLCSDGPAVVDLSPMLNNFDDTASFVAGMDLVISVDTAVMHLSAAMGKETWGLIPYNPDWRWGLYGSDTPLYSNLKLFRQTQKNDWRSVMGAVGAKLREKLSPR